MVGDIVNLSARLMVKAKDLGGVICDEVTYLAANKHVEFKTLTPVNVKGKKQAVKIFFPHQVLAIAKLNLNRLSNRNRSEEEEASKEVLGRAKALALVEHKIKQLKTKNQPGNVLVLEGEAGMGKTRIVGQMKFMIDEEAEIFYGTTDGITMGQSYGSWAEIFNAVLDLGSVEDPSQLLSHIRKQLRRIPPNLPLPDMVPGWTKLAPLLKSILPLEIPENELTATMTDQSRAENLQLLLIRLLQTSVMPGSVIVLDDAHLFDTASWALTLAVSQQLKGVLVVVCLRPLKPPFPFEYQQITHCENAHQINLTPLSPEDSVTLAKQFLGVEKIPPQLATQIAEKGQGIPYLIEELSQSLKDSGFITIENGECKVKPGKELVLPSTIRQLITSKVDKLTATQRALLKVASVIGKTFDAVLLMELYPEGLPTLEEDLDALENAGFVCKEVEQTTGPKTKLTMRGFNSARDLDSGVISGHTPRTPSGDISIALRRPSAGLTTNPSPRSLSPGKSSILAERVQAEQGTLPPITTSPPPQRASQPGSPENGTSVNTPPKPKGGKSSPRPRRVKGDLEASGGDKEKLNLENSSGSAKGAKNRRKNRKKVTRASSEKTPGTKNINDVTDKHEEMTRSTPEIPEYVTPRELERSPSGRKYRTLSRTLTRTLRFNQAGPAAEEPAKNREFSFKNQTVHEVVYQLMLFSQRRQLHKKVAEWYEQNHADNLSSFSGLLAHHWKLSDANPNKAKNYYVQAGDQCLRIFSNREAVNFFMEALTLEKRAKKRDSTGKQESTSGFGFLAGNLAKTGKTILNLVNGAKLDVKERTDDPEMMANSIRLRRKLGQAYYSMGLFSKSTMYLKRALKMARLNLNYSDVSSNSRHMATTYQHILKAHPLIQRETVLSLLSLAKVHYYSCNRTFSTYCNELALVVAEKANFWAEQCEAYSQCILTAGLTNQHSLASVYMEMGSKLAQEKLDLVSNLLQMSGVYYCGRASWSKTEKCFEEAAASCQRTGDRRRYEECNIFLAMSLYLQGQIKRSLQFSKTALDSARLRGDIQCQILALSSQTCCHITLGNIIKASAKLDQIRLALGKDDTNAVDKAVAGGDISSSLNYNALMALMCLQKGEPGNAWEFARMADQILSSKNVEPTAFFTFPGYMGLPEIYLRLLLQPKCWSDLHLTQQKLIRRINNSLKALEEFCKVFPFAYPRMYLLQGLFLLAAGADMSKVIIAWKSGLRQAIKYHMTYEREIIRAHLNLDKDNSLQSYRLTSSASLSSPLFDRSGELKVLHRENSSGPESTNIGESGPNSKSGMPDLTPRRIAAEALKRSDSPNRERLAESDYDISSASDEELKENTVDEIIAEVRRTTKKLDDMKEEEEEESETSEEERQFREVVSDPEDTYDSDDDVLDSARRRPSTSVVSNTNAVNNNTAAEVETKKVVDESKVNKEKNKNNKPAGTSGTEAANNDKKAKVPLLQLSPEAKDRSGKDRLLQMSANGSNNNMNKLKYKRVKHMSSDSYRKGLPAFEKELKKDKERQSKKKDKSPRVAEVITEEAHNDKPTSPRSDPASPKPRTVDPKNVRERNKNNKKTKDKPTIVVVSSPRANNNAAPPNGSTSPRSADPISKKTPNGLSVKDKSKQDKQEKRNSEPKAKRKTKS
jgi:tetratricopeptide (TPR) repeat protein